MMSYFNNDLSSSVRNHVCMLYFKILMLFPLNHSYIQYSLQHCKNLRAQTHIFDLKSLQIPSKADGSYQRPS